MKRFIYTLITSISILATTNVLALDAKEYHKILKNEVRHSEKYAKSDLGASLIVDAYLLNSKLINAQGEYWASHYSSEPGSSESKIAELKAQNKGELTFFVLFYTNQRKYDDLKQPDNGWNISLKYQGQYYQPTSIDKYKKKTAEQMLFFPTDNIWFTAYVIRFPLSDGIQNGIQLDIRGLTTAAELNW